MISSKKINSQKSSGESAGAALVEFAIVLPLMVLIFSGLLEIGRVLSELNWISQTAFNLVALHGGTPKSYAPQLMNDRFNRLKTAKINEFSRVGLTVSDPQPLFEGGSYYQHLANGTEVVGIKLAASIQPLTTILEFSLPVNIEVTGPFLLPDTSAAGPFEEFQNPSLLYNCDGVQCENGKGGKECGGGNCF